MPTRSATSRNVIWESPCSCAICQEAARISPRVVARRSAARSRIGVPNTVRILLRSGTVVKTQPAGGPVATRARKDDQGLADAAVRNPGLRGEAGSERLVVLA